MSTARPALKQTSNLIWPLNHLSNWIYGVNQIPSDSGVITVPPSPISPTVNSDAYDKFVVELQGFQETLNNDIKAWEQKQIEVLGSVIYPHIKIEKPADDSSVVRKFFAELKNKFLGIFESPKEILEKMENDIEPHVKEFEAHLKQECARLHAIKDKNSLEAKTVKGEICHLAIEIADAHMLLTDNLLAELNKAMLDKQFQHDLWNQIWKSILDTFIKIPLPAFDFNPAYRNNLYQEVSGIKVIVEQDYAEVEAMIAEAMSVLKEDDNKSKIEMPAVEHPTNDIPSDLHQLYNNVDTLFSDRVSRRRAIREQQQQQAPSHLLSHSL